MPRCEAVAGGGTLPTTVREGRMEVIGQQTEIGRRGKVRDVIEKRGDDDMA